MKFQIGITTAPRQVSTLAQTLQSLRENGFEEAFSLFIEKGTLLPADESRNCFIFCNERRPGVVMNSYWGLRHMLKQGDGSPILFLQDDVVFCRSAQEKLLAAPQDGVLLGFTHEWLVNGRHSYIGGGDGWQELRNTKSGGDIHGALCYVFTPKVLERLLMGKYMTDVIMKVTLGEIADQHWDNHVAVAAVSEGIPMYCHNPSLVDHIGEWSVVYGVEKRLEGRRGYRFSAQL